MVTKNNKKVRLIHQPVNKLVLSAMMVAIGVVLPFFTGQVQQIGNMLLPMHLPVFLCGLICGWQYGAAVGFVLPLFRWCMFGMPILYPNAIAMSMELAAYGLFAGLIYSCMKEQHVLSIYATMLPAMLLGRGMWGVAQICLLGLADKSFTWQMFISGAFLNAVPGIILQLVIVPGIMSVLHITGMYKFRKQATDEYDESNN